MLEARNPKFEQQPKKKLKLGYNKDIKEVKKDGKWAKAPFSSLFSLFSETGRFYVKQQLGLELMVHIGNNERRQYFMEKVVEKLDNINKTLEGILQILSTPENKVMTIFKYIGQE